jgi:hypothetical protein
VATFNPGVSEDDLTLTVLDQWKQFHPTRLRGNSEIDQKAARAVARETLETARLYVEKLAYSNSQALSEAMREIALQ